MADGEVVTGLERIIKFGQVIANQNASTSNTLFGDLPMSMEIPPPRLPECEQWSLTKQLEHEKDVTRMFLSGHPLDHYKFEMRHYGVTPIADFNEFRDSIALQSNPNRTFRILGLVADAQHRVARSGNKFGSFVIEDYSGKTEIVLFSEDYLRLSPVMQQGTSVYMTGYLKQRWNKSEFEFKVTSVSLAETMKKSLTKQLNIDINPQYLSPDIITFLEKNLKYHPGSAGLRFTMTDPKANMRVSLVSSGRGFEMNEEMIHFLEEKKELEIQVLTN